MQQQQQEDHPSPKASGAQQVGQRNVVEEHQEIMRQQPGRQGGQRRLKRCPSEHQQQVQADAQPQPESPLKLASCQSPHAAAAEFEKDQHTATQKQGSSLVTGRRRSYKQSDAAEKPIASTPEQSQQPLHQRQGAVKHLGVDSDVPLISSAPYATTTPEKQPPPAGLWQPLPTSSAPTTASPAVPAVLAESDAGSSFNNAGEAGVGDEEDKNEFPHSTPGSNSHDNCQHVGHVPREEVEVERAGAAATCSPRSDGAGLHLAEAVLGLHVPEDAFADAAVHSSSLAATQRSPDVGTPAAPAYGWECTLGDGVGGGHAGDSAGPPVLSSPLHSNVFPSEATSESVGSLTSPAVSPAVTSSPSAASPALPASPTPDLSARGSRPPPTLRSAPFAGVCRASLSTALRDSSAADIAQEDSAAEEEPCSTSPARSCVYEETRPRTRGRTASQQQIRAQGDRCGEKKPRSNSAGGSSGGRSNDSTGDFLSSINSRGESSSASSARCSSSSTASSPSAGASSSRASSSSSPPSAAAALAPSSFSSSADVSCSASACASDHAARIEAVPSAAPPSPGRRDGGSLTTRGRRCSSWGRQLNGTGDAVDVVFDKSIYRQQQVKRPEQRPVLLPNGEPLPGLRRMYDSKKQSGQSSPPVALDWNGPVALPYNAEEVPPSPFSRETYSHTSTPSCSSVWPEQPGLAQILVHRRESPATAFAEIHPPPRPFLLSRHHALAGRPRSACNAALNHADFSPPSPFPPQSSRSFPLDARAAASQPPLPYPQVAVHNCALHQQLHTFVYPFAVEDTVTDSAKTPSSFSTSLFCGRSQSATAEPQQPVLTYCISNNGMGEALPYGSGRGAAAKKRTSRRPWLSWLWPWRQHHTASTNAPQQERSRISYEMQERVSSLQNTSGSSRAFPSSSRPPTTAAAARPAPAGSSPVQEGGGADSSRNRKGGGKPSLSLVRKGSDMASMSSADRRPPAATRKLPAPPGSSSTSSFGGADRWRGRGRGTFVLAAVSAALEIGCVWRFPSCCVKFGGATFLLAYVVLLLILGVPVLALEMALGQVFRGGQMKVLNLISPRLRGLAAATLVLSLFICAYYSIFVSWTLQFLFSSIRPSLPWGITSREAAICAAAGHNIEACSLATYSTPQIGTNGVLEPWQLPNLDDDDEQQQQLQPLSEAKHLQQAARQLSAEQTTGVTSRKYNKDMRQLSFCAWQRPVSGGSKGVCVADEKLKSRTFLYTDVIGLWVKTTEHPSAVPGVFFSAAAGAEEASPVRPSTAGDGGGGAAAAGKKEEDAGLLGGAAAVAAAAPSEQAVTAERGDAEVSSPPPEAALRDDLRYTSSSSGRSVRRLTPYAAAADERLGGGASPRVTSVTMAASLWNITPVVAAGLAAVWMQIYLFSLRGYKPTKTFVYITAGTPIMAMLLIAGLALSLDGASLGLQLLFSPSPQNASSFSFSPPAPTDAAVAHASARILHEYVTNEDTPGSDVLLLPSGALSRRVADAVVPPGGEDIHTAASVSQMREAARCVGSECAPALVGPTPASEQASAASVGESPVESSSNSGGSGDILSSISRFRSYWWAAGSHTVWGEAAAQVFFSLGVFQGVVTAYASHKHLTENVLVDAVAAVVKNLGMSLLAAVATFSVAGHIAKHLGATDTHSRTADLSALQDVQGSQLVFVLYPLVFNSLPAGLAQVACILCFLALLLLGLTSVVGLVQPAMGLLRHCAWMGKYPRWKTAGAVCSTGLLIGLPFCTRGGLLLVEAADYRWTVVGLVFIGCCESIAFGWLYGVGRQAQCIGYLPLLLHGVTYWLAVLLAAVVLFLTPPPHNTPGTALAVGVSVAAAGAAAALWCCPWEGRCRRKQQFLAQQQSQRDIQKEVKKQDQPSEELRQTQRADLHLLNKKKGKPQTGTAEKGRVKFTNGCPGNRSSTPATDAVGSSSNSSTQRFTSRANGNAEGEMHTQSGSSDNGNGSNTLLTGSDPVSSDSAAAAVSSTGGSSTAPSSSSRQEIALAAGRSNDRNTGSEESGVGSGDAGLDRGSAAPSAGTAGGDSDTTSRLLHRDSSSSGTESGGDSSKADAVDDATNTGGVGSSVTGVANLSENASEGHESSDVVGQSSDALTSSGGASSTSVANSCGGSSSNGNGTNDARGQRDVVVVVDRPRMSAAAAKSPKQQQQQMRYGSPRSRSGRRRRGGRSFVLIKRDGEALPFLSCAFWLFVGNVEHLRKNLNAITCSGYRVLRLWPPWSLVIRYIIPTILLLLVVQELPELFATVSRYGQPLPPGAAAAGGRSAGTLAAAAAAAAAAIAHYGVQQQPPLASGQQEALLQRGPLPQQFRQNTQMLQQFGRSLVAIQVFTLAALLLVVGLVLLGLLFPHLWDAFILKERRRRGIDASSAAASSFRSMSLQNSSSRLPAETEMTGAPAASSARRQQQMRQIECESNNNTGVNATARSGSGTQAVAM